jgi:phage regulator Rha-like protein
VPKTQAMVPVERIESRILPVRGHKVMLDSDLAELYGVETKVLVQAVKRNVERFPPDFMVRLSKQEFTILRSQSVTSSQWGGRRYPPYAFTEHGAVMLASVLNSPVAVQASVEVVRAFIRLRELLATQRQLARKLAELEQNCSTRAQLIQTSVFPHLEEPLQRTLHSLARWPLLWRTGAS